MEENVGKMSRSFCEKPVSSDAVGGCGPLCGPVSLNPSGSGFLVGAENGSRNYVSPDWTWGRVAGYDLWDLPYGEAFFAGDQREREGGANLPTDKDVGRLEVSKAGQGIEN